MSQPYIVVIDDNPADVELLRISLDEHGEAYELVASPMARKPCGSSQDVTAKAATPSLV
jgi:hypothetical protein